MEHILLFDDFCRRYLIFWSEGPKQYLFTFSAYNINQGASGAKLEVLYKITIIFIVILSLDAAVNYNYIF